MSFLSSETVTNRFPYLHREFLPNSSFSKLPAEWGNRLYRYILNHHSVDYATLITQRSIKGFAMWTNSPLELKIGIFLKHPVICAWSLLLKLRDRKENLHYRVRNGTAELLMLVATEKRKGIGTELFNVSLMREPKGFRIRVGVDLKEAQLFYEKMGCLREK